MLTVLVIFIVALPVLAASVPANSSDLEIKKMLKHCANVQAGLTCPENKHG